MDIPRIRILIEHEPADKVAGGGEHTGEVTAIYSNLPARYFEVAVEESVVTERNEEGEVIGLTFNPSHPSGEVPFQIYGPGMYESDDWEREEAPSEWRAQQEWTVFFWLTDDNPTYALVLKAKNVVEAAQRVEQEFPGRPIMRVEQASLGDGDQTPMTYLERYDIILPVGGARVPKFPAAHKSPSA